MRFPLSVKILLGVAVILAAALSYGGYRYYTLSTLHTEALATTSAHITELEKRLVDAEQSNEDLAYSLSEEKRRNDEFYSQISEISGTVGKLDKLSKTDEELLQKYSKVYFLNENYIPSDLIQIPQSYIHDDDDEFFHENAWPFLETLLKEAEEDGMELSIVSGYRSFDTQRELKGAYTVTYGSGANTFSADQGYSEHQLGTAIDFSTKALGGGLSGFGNTEEYDWLLQNAYKYGFILSYPEENGYYVFEPWHWRFVGKKLARDLHSDDESFYHLDQREIDEYLINIFD